MGSNVDLHVNLAAVLKSADVAALVNPVVHEIAAKAQHTTTSGVDLPIVVDEYTTDRRAASVTIAHPAGLATEAKHGTLTKAAAAAGLEVRSR